MQARFWSKVAIGAPSECWPWRACKFSNGYGAFGIKGKLLGAHRVAWQLSRGDAIPVGLQVLHSCDNPPCVNPAHLRVGTPADNMADKMKRGRYVNGLAGHPERVARGERHGSAVLSTADVLTIRAELARGRKGKDLAADFGVRAGTISAIKVRRLWAHI